MGAAVSRGQLVEPTHAKRARESKVQQRVQLLEELVQGPTQSRRQQLLQQLTPDTYHGDGQGYFLPSAPEEFKLGCLIAAGSYGRVYAGSYCGSPAALKLLILEEESAAAILNEVRLCLKLNHKNLVRLLDCAVVSTSSSGQPGNPQASGGNWLSSSPAVPSLQQPSPCNYSYLPLLAPAGAAQQQQQPGSPAAAPAVAPGYSVIARASEPHGFGGWFTGNDLLSQHDSQQRQLGLMSPAGHACFEVWIAMELCDGGTLAEQVQRGFQYHPESKQVDMELLLLLAIDIARALSYMHSEHVCHGDLKSENVLLKSEGPDSLTGSFGCGGASSCFGSSDECSWLGMLCSTASSSSCPSRCRRHSDDSCFSCCSGNINGSSAVARQETSGASSGWCISRQGPSSISSSASSSPVSRHGSSSRGTAFTRSGNLLSFPGLCCLAHSSACVGEDGDDEQCLRQQDAEQQQEQQQQHGVASLWGSSCGTAQVSRTSRDMTGDAAAAAAGGRLLDQQQFAADGMGPINTQISTFTPVASSSLQFSQHAADVVGDAEAVAAAQQQQLDLVSALQAAQQQQQQLSYECEGMQQRAPYDGGEEEHIAPLSLYNTVREHRRSRRLSQSAMLPNLQAAIAAAAARMQQQQVQGWTCPTSNPTSSSSGAAGDVDDSSREDDDDDHSSDRDAAQLQQHNDAPLLLNEEYAAAAAAAASEASRNSRPASSFFSNPGSVYASEASSPGEACSTRIAAAAAESSSCTMPTVDEGQPSLQQQEQQRLGRTATGHDVYARRLPPRARRHSYCYGTRLPGDPRTLLGGFCGASGASISATEAATAIAAAAEALKHDNAVRNSGSAAAAAAAAAAGAAGRPRRNRRMSCDDRLLLQGPNSLAGTASLQLPLLRAASGDSSSNPLFGRVTGLGRPPAALRRAGSGNTSYMDYRGEQLPSAAGFGGAGSNLGFAASGLSASAAASAAGGSQAGDRPRRTRRHSWTLGYDGSAAAAAAAAGEATGLWGLRALTSFLLPQEQQQQQQQGAAADQEEAVRLLAAPSRSQDGRKGSASADDDEASPRSSSSGQLCSVAESPQMPLSGALVCCPGLSFPGSSNSGASRRSSRTRRHSWAGFAGVLPDTLFGFDQPGSLSRSRRASLTSQQSPGRRPSLFHLPACCGDSGYLPLDDASNAAGGEFAEAQQPLLPSGQISSVPASSEEGSCSFSCGLGSSGIGLQLEEGCTAVSVSCLGRMLSSSNNGRQGRRSSWCCSGSNSQQYGPAGDWSVGSGSSSMAALLTPGSFEPSSSLPLMPRGQHCNGRGSGRRGRAGRRCSWDGPRDAAVMLAFDSGAAAAAASMKLQQQDQVENAQFCKQQQQRRGSLVAQCSPVSDTAASSRQVGREAMSSYPAAATSPAAGNDALQQQLVVQAAAACSSSSEPPAALQPAASAAAAADSTPAAKTSRDATPSNSSAQLAPVCTPPAAPRPAAAPAGPAAHVAAAAAVAAGSTCLESPTCVQSVGYHALFAPCPEGTLPVVSPASAATSPGCASDAVQTPASGVVSSDSSCASVDVVQLLGGYGRGHDIPVATATPQPFINPVRQVSLAGSSGAQDQQQQQQQPEQQQQLVGSFGSFGGSSSRRASISGLPNAQEPWQQQLLGSYTATGSGAAATAGFVCEIQPASSSISGKPSPQATLGSSVAGSFGLMSGVASTRASGSSSAARGRRWSTGVAAHDLLARKHALMMPSPGSQLSRDLDGFGSSGPGSGISSVRCRVSISSRGPDGSFASSLEEMQEVADSGAALAAAAAAAAGAAAAPAGPGSYVGGGSAAGLSRPGSLSSLGGCSTFSSGSHHVVNVLGIPPKPAAVLNQRRMSYDTATGSYLLVTKIEQEQQEQERLLAQQQQQQQLQLLLPQQPVQDVTAPIADQQQQQQEQQQQQQAGKDTAPAGSSSATLQPQQQQQQQQQQLSPQLQLQVQVEDVQPAPCNASFDSGISPGPAAQQFQAHVQRLVAALAKKGYSTSMLDGNASSFEQQQQQGSASAYGVGPSSSSAAAAAAAPVRQRSSNTAGAALQAPRPRYTAKVCDFGFSQCLRAGQSHCSTAAAGTITHQAPEVLRSGHLSPAADIYAFGIILWELLTGELPFKGMLEGDLFEGVVYRKLRPVFPPGAPAAYVALAQQCWADDAAERPTAAQLQKRLNEMLYDVRRARATQLQQLQQQGISAAGGSDAANQCRRRRHSMPVVGSGRQRRMSRRLSLFLPFSRQPAAVPEHEPLEQAGVSDTNSGRVSSRINSCDSRSPQQQQLRTPFATLASSSTASAAAVSTPPGAGAAAVAAARARRASGASTSSSSTHASGSFAAGTGSSASGHAVRLQALASGAALGRGGMVSSAGATAGSSAVADPTNQWFQSFDD